MKELFIPLRLAVIAKKKGFNEPCLTYWDRSDKTAPINLKRQDIIFSGQMIFPDNSTLAPLYQQIVDWFRDKHNIIISIQLDQTSTIKWAYDIVKFNGFMEFERKTNLLKWSLYRDYYQAHDSAIEEAFDLIKSK